MNGGQVPQLAAAVALCLHNCDLGLLLCKTREYLFDIAIHSTWVNAALLLIKSHLTKCHRSWGQNQNNCRSIIAINIDDFLRLHSSHLEPFSGIRYHRHCRYSAELHLKDTSSVLHVSSILVVAWYQEMHVLLPRVPITIDLNISRFTDGIFVGRSLRVWIPNFADFE